jgi:hypothetical protein
MSPEPPEDGAPQREGWAPPSGWSPEQPPAWPAGSTQPPAAGPPPDSPPQQGPPPGYQPQGLPPGYPPQHGYSPPQGSPPQHGYSPPQGYPPPQGDYRPPQGDYPPPGSPPPTGPGPGHPGGPPPGWGQQPQPWTPPPQAPKPGIVPLRPIGIGELLDGALGLIRSNPRTVLGLAATISAVSALVQTVGIWVSLRVLDAPTTLVTSDVADGPGDVAADVTALATAGVAQLVPGLMAGFLQVLASGLFIVLVAAAVLGRRLNATETWENLRPRLLPLIGLTLLLGLGAAVAVLGLVGVIVLLVVTLGQWGIVPALLIGVGGLALVVFVYVRLSVASPALVIEGLGPTAALGRSWRLVRGSWWRVLGILVLAAIITNLLTTIISVPVTTVASFVTGVSDSLLPTVLAAGLATLIAGILTLPFSAAVTGLLYTDLRMRREALDIQLASAGITPTADPLAPYRLVR